MQKQKAITTRLLIIITILPLITSQGTIDFSRFELDSTPRDLVWCGELEKIK